MFSAAWKMLKDTILAFINDEALSRGEVSGPSFISSFCGVVLMLLAMSFHGRRL
jgi:hypothetical protein